MQLYSKRNRFTPSRGLKTIGGARTTERICRIKGIHHHGYIRSLRIRVIVERYFYVPSHDIVLTPQDYMIDCTRFVDDHNEPVERFRDFGKSGYFNLFINGVMQGSSFYRISSKHLTLTATGQTIYQGTPIIIESIGFLLRKRK